MVDSCGEPLEQLACIERSSFWAAEKDEAVSSEASEHVRLAVDGMAMAIGGKEMGKNEES